MNDIENFIDKCSEMKIATEAFSFGHVTLYNVSDPSKNYRKHIYSKSIRQALAANDGLYFTANDKVAEIASKNSSKLKNPRVVTTISTPKNNITDGMQYDTFELKNPSKVKTSEETSTLEELLKNNGYTISIKKSVVRPDRENVVKLFNAELAEIFKNPEYKKYGVVPYKDSNLQDFLYGDYDSITIVSGDTNYYSKTGKDLESISRNEYIAIGNNTMKLGEIIEKRLIKICPKNYRVFMDGEKFEFDIHLEEK